VGDACYHPAKRGKLLGFDQRILGLAQTPQRSLSCVTSINNLTLRALALDELTELAADGSQHVEQILIGLPDLATEKLDHAQGFPPEQDGKGEGRVYSFALGAGSARKVFIRNDIGNVFGLKAGPYPAR
jgi:hypothetical protein